MSPPFSSASRGLHRSLYWRSRRNSPLDVSPRSTPPGRKSEVGARKALGDSGAPGRVAEPEKNLIDQPLLLPAQRQAHKPKRYRETPRAATGASTTMTRTSSSLLVIITSQSR